jgi:class 3 adenylate cyclase
MATRNAAVMFTDIKGFTSRTSNATRDGVRSLLGEHDRLLRPVFRYFGGVVIKTIGDAFLVRFDSSTDAVVCGLALQSVLTKHNERAAEAERFLVRVAINVGDIVLQDDDVFGEPVNLAARLEEIVEPGEVWFTEAVYLTMNRKEVPTTEIGERTFRGIPRPVRVYKVLRDPPNDQIRQIDAAIRLERGVPRLEGLREHARPGTTWRRWAVAAIVSVLIGPTAAVVGLDVWNTHRALDRIERLLELDDAVPAMDLADRLLNDLPAHERLRALSLRASERHLKQRVERGDAPEEIRDWLSGRLARHGHLEPLRDRYVQLEARVALERAFDDGRARAFWSTFRELLSRYPASVSLPVVAADVLERRDQIAESRLWPYELFIERGGIAEDPVLLEAMRDAVFLTFDRNLPASNYGASAHAVARAMFAEDLGEWAVRALAEGTGAALANALHIQSDYGNRIDEPSYRALQELLAAKDVERNVAVLAAERDPVRRDRILQVLETDDFATRPELGEDGRALVRDLLTSEAYRQDRSGGAEERP